jgi:hypothetical protein
MCIILLAETKQITKAILEKAEDTNPHGAGIAWINDKTKTKNVKWIKGINLNTKGILRLIKINKIKTPYIIHFRIASIGSTSDQLCHPFDLNALLTENKQSGNSEAGVLFHNGTMTDYKTHYDLVFEAGKLNDTKGIFNDIELELSDSRVMSYISNKNRLGLGYLEKVTGQKIAVLTKEGIKTYGAGWENIEEIKMSNDHGMRYNSCETNFYGYESYNQFGYSTCYPQIEEKTKYEAKQIIKQTEKRIKELENKLKSKSKMGKKELKKINKSLKKSKKRLNKELKKEIAKYKKELVEIEKLEKQNALNKKQSKITSYNGHGKHCNCLKCYKSRDLQIDLNRQRYEDKVKITSKAVQSDKITELGNLEKSLITRKFESKDIDYFNDLLDSDYILGILRDINSTNLSDQDQEKLFNYLKSLTYEMYDNIFTGNMDNETLRIDLLEKSKTYEFSKGWKNELVNGVRKW